MFKNYIKIAARNLFKNKLYSGINIFGLAIGMAACLMIYLWVQNELSFDRFHSKADRIFRVERRYDFQGMHGLAPITSGPYGPALVQDYPEIENFVRLDRNELAIKDHRNINRKQSLIFADNSIFEIFDFRLEQGDPKTALTQPRTVVLTRKSAQKFLGTEDIAGKSLTVDWDGEQVDFQITGILEEVPVNSHVQFEMVASFETYPEELKTIWFNNSLFTFVLLGKGMAPGEVEAKLPSLLTKYMAADFLAVVGQEVDINDVFKLELKPLTDIHLHPAEQFEIEAQGSLTAVYIFSSIALLILFIACINFVNLSTARAGKRAREVGLRKTIGAYRHQLWSQFLGESVFTAFLSLLLALILIRLSLSVFNTISGRELSFAQLFQHGNWLALIGITLITGFLAGLYPAFFLTSFEPVNVLKGGSHTRTKKSAFRRIMAVAQFVISIALIIGTVVIHKQMKFIQNKSLGFDKENVIVIPVENRKVRQGIDAFRNNLTADSRIRSVTSSSNIPGSYMFSDTVFKKEDSDDVFDIAFLQSDYDFVKAYDLKLIEGRDFSREFGTDQDGALILNESAVRKIGYTPEEAVGKKLSRYASATEFISGTIVGVVEDFHFKSLHLAIEPFILMLQEGRINMISTRISPGDVRGTIDLIRQKWTALFPEIEFEYTFLDSRIDLLYESEGRQKSLFLIFSFLSIFVACLGLFGLAAFTAQERTKEIGIRKALGASSTSIFVLLSREFAKWVLLANLVAWPLAYFAMKRWLENFAYQTGMGPLPFFLAAVLALFIALFSVSYQAVKSALSNPSDSLRYE